MTAIMTEQTRPHLRATLVLCCLAQLMVVLDLSIVNVALPSIRNALHFNEANLQWVVNAYTITFTGFLLLGGRAGDLLGRRIVFVSGLVLFAVASLVGGLSDSQGMLIAARAAQGLAGAVIAPASLSILTTTFTDKAKRNRAVGIWGAMGGAGGVVGSLLRGIITTGLTWRWILFINVPIGLIVALTAQRLVAEGRNPGQARYFDLSGAVSSTLGLSLLVLGIIRTDQTGWGSGPTIGLIVAGLALLVGFAVLEGRFAKVPLMPLGIFASRTLSAANVVVMMVGAASFGMWYFLTLYLQQVLGYSALRAGLAFLPMALCIFAGAMIASRSVTRLGPKRLLIVGMLSLGAGLLLFTGISQTGSYLSDILAGSLLIALGLGFAFVTGTIAAISGVQPREADLASGLVNTARTFGGALGLAILAAIATAHTNTQLKHGAAPHAALTSGFQVAFAVAAGLAFAGALTAFAGLPQTPRRAPSPTQTPIASPKSPS